MWSPDMKGSTTAEWTEKELKRKLYLAVANVNILEGIRFYVSFACSFAFGELKVMEGSAKIISLISTMQGDSIGALEMHGSCYKQ